MPRRNRVDPAGRLHAVSERGLFMGNRGCLHDAHGAIRQRKPPTDRWIICLTEFKSRKRALMQPRRYTELFFLDEATALAAVHRPCFECRRVEARAFARALARAQGVDHLSANAIDHILKPQRCLPLDEDTRRVTGDRVESLPEGAVISHDGLCFLVTDNGLARWSFGGYLAPDKTAFSSSRQQFRIVTPPAIIGALRQGYRPALHPSALTAAT